MRALTAWFLGPARTAATVVAITLLLLAFLGSALGPRLMGLVRSAGRHLFTHTVTATATAPVLVQQLQGLNRLETARQVSQHVIEVRSEGIPLPEFLVGDKLLAVLETETVSGVDLRRLSAGDVRMEGETAVIRLPDPEVLSVRIEDEHSRVYSRQRGWLVHSPDPDLERQARLKATADARRAALESNVMDVARTNAEESLRSLLLPLGVREVRVQWGASASADQGGGVPVSGSAPIP
ncbi:MAG: DUF4230 domain-containing protein [Armatimonadetes bacterium]|nr:DUF4230 domain-containing protein [Armatimonadota bacterium]